MVIVWNKVQQESSITIWTRNFYNVSKLTASKVLLLNSSTMSLPLDIKGPLQIFIDGWTITWTRLVYLPKLLWDIVNSGVIPNFGIADTPSPCLKNWQDLPSLYGSSSYYVPSAPPTQIWTANPEILNIYTYIVPTIALAAHTNRPIKPLKSSLWPFTTSMLSMKKPTLTACTH